MVVYKKILSVILVIGLVTVVLTGCSSDSDVIKVGSKEYTEQLVLGQLAVVALEEAGLKVEDKTNITGSDKVRSAFENGDLDLFWEYTGVTLIMDLGYDEPITDMEECYRVVKEADRKKGYVWLDYAKLNNTYTVMLTEEKQKELGITKISELAEIVNDKPESITFAADHEFAVRPDGVPGMEKTYDFKFKDENIKIMDTGIVYKTLREGKVNSAMGYRTDGRIKEYNLVNLEDDKSFFPAYSPAPLVREEVLEKHPEVKNILNEVAQSLTVEDLTDLNYQVDIEEREPKEVAREWLSSKGIID